MKIIAAVDLEGTVGLDGGLPWKQKADLKNFKRLTKNGTVVMGRGTWESLPGKGLPGRRIVVVSKSLAKAFTQQRWESYKAKDPDRIVDDPDLLLHSDSQRHEDFKRMWLIGGPRIWDWALRTGLVTDVYLTVVLATTFCERCSPGRYLAVDACNVTRWRPDLSGWKVEVCEGFGSAAGDDHPVVFTHWKKK